MELRLSLGDSPAPAKAAVAHALTSVRTDTGENDELVLELGVGIAKRDEQENKMNKDMQAEEAEEEGSFRDEPPGAVELSLRPLLPDLQEIEVCTRGFDVNTVPVDGDGGATANYLTSPSSVKVEVPVRRRAVDHHKGGEDEENDGGGGGGRAVRKKLRLSKEQAAFLEDSFKNHSTLTPKQKSDLANELKLRPRQVEVWFQNRRARTKLKQTEVDYEYLKHCCDTLTQENRRLQRELAELRGFPTTHPFHTALSAISTVSIRPPCDDKVTSMATFFAKPDNGPFTVHPMRHHPSSTTGLHLLR